MNEIAEKLRDIHNDIRDECNSAMCNDIALFHSRPEIFDMLLDRLHKIEALSGEADKLLADKITA